MNLNKRENLDPIQTSEYTLNFKVPFPSERAAEIAFNSLIADKEPKNSTVKKCLDYSDNNLEVTLTGPNARHIRAASTSLLELILLIIKTQNRFKC